MGVHRRNTAKRRTKLGLALEQSANEILAHMKGEAKLPTRRIVLPEEIDVKRIRSQARMSQAEFARAFCINPRTLQEWEQGRRNGVRRTGVVTLEQPARLDRQGSDRGRILTFDTSHLSDAVRRA